MSDVKNAAEVIAAVMNDVQGLAKKDMNKQQGFNFRGIDAVMNAVGPALRTHGGFIVPAIDSVRYEAYPSKSGGQLNVCHVTVTYAVHGQKGDPILGSVSAEAFDSGDKATAKAMSVAYRTFLLQLLCLPTDEPDPDTYTYELDVPVEWDAEIANVTTRDEAKELYIKAKQSRAAKSVLERIEAKGKELS